jgi:hypothetical protein
MDYEQEYEIWYLSLNVQFEDRTEKVVVKSIPQTITRSVFFISLPPYPGIHMWSGFDNSSYRYLAQFYAICNRFSHHPCRVHDCEIHRRL